MGKQNILLKKKTSILFLLFLFLTGHSYGQDTVRVVEPDMQQILVSDTITQPADSLSEPAVSDTIHPRDLSAIYTPPAVTIDTTKKINYWRITERTGEIIPIVPDTFLTDYFNRTHVEGLGTAVAYLGNLGLPVESRLFFEREDRSEFLFADALRAYLKQPGQFNFINTKIPHSNVTYQSAGSRQNKEERLQALLTFNVGKKLNIGTSMDYLYARGFYNSQSAKHTDWVFFGNYLSDRHQVHFFANPASSYTNAENGGIQEDYYIAHPELVNSRNTPSKSIPTRFENTWNTLQGSRYYLNYHYNLGFERDTGQKDEEENEIKQFIPVSSIIYTLDYTNRKHRFYTQDSATLNRFYDYVDYLNPIRKKEYPSDSTSYRSIKNTLALSLREGFNPWAKFDLTAFITHDIRKFTLMDTTVSNIPDTTLFAAYTATQYATYIGGELAKRRGKILRYNAQGSFGIVGYNVGDFILSGNIETRIPFLNDTASVSANGYIKNLSPTFYENHYHSQYFWWNNRFSKVRKVHVGGRIVVPYTQTELSLGVENVTNYIYFDSDFLKQYSKNIQVLAAGLKQNFKLSALNWNNELVYQTSSNQDIIPLPLLCAYSSLYLQFVVTKVLTVQMGANVHYWTKYYSPTYEPATQQFKLQNDVKVGDYPLVNGFLNCHLKQTRFFLEYYNLGAMFINPPNYFSMPHYPVNPPVLKLGLSVDFIN